MAWERGGERAQEGLPRSVPRPAVGFVPRRRRTVLFGAVFYALPAALFVFGFLWALIGVVGGDAGFAILLVISGLFGFLLAYQFVQHLIDIWVAPMMIEGEIGKKWSKGNFLFFFPSLYIAVGGLIFSIPRYQYGELLEGDHVRVVYLPHTLTLESLERFDSAESEFVPVGLGGART